MQFPANPTLVVVLQSHIFSYGVAASRGNRFLSRCDVSNMMAEDRSFMEDSARESGLGHCNARKAPESAPAQNGRHCSFFLPGSLLGERTQREPMMYVVL